MKTDNVAKEYLSEMLVIHCTQEHIWNNSPKMETGDVTKYYVSKMLFIYCTEEHIWNNSPRHAGRRGVMPVKLGARARTCQ